MLQYLTYTYRFFLLIGLLIITESSFSQYIATSYPQKLSAKTPRFRVLGKYSKGYVVERYGSDQHILDVYNSTLDLQFSKEFKNKKNSVINEIWLQPQGAWMIYTNMGKESSVLSAVWLDTRFNIAEKTIILDTLYERKDLVQANLRFDYSENHTHTGYFMPVFDNGKLDYFLILVFNSKLQLITKKKIDQTHLEGLDFMNAEITNQGEAILIFKQDNGKKNTGIEEYMIFYVSSKQLKKFSYQPARMVDKKPRFQIDNANNRLIISGFYESSESQKKEKGAEAIFFDLVELPTGKLILSTSEPFTDNFYFNLTGKYPSAEGPVLHTFYINSIIPKMDGGAMVLVESYYKDEDEIYAPGAFVSPTFNTYRTISTYHYNDIVVFDFNSSGNVEDVHLIRKRQESENDRGAYASFFTMNERDRLRLLFLDEITENASMMEYVFSDQWAGERTSLFSVGAKEVMPVAKMARQTSINEVIIPSFQNNFLSLIKIVY